MSELSTLDYGMIETLNFDRESIRIMKLNL